MFYDYLCKGKSLYLSTQCLLITISFPYMDIVDKLNKEFLTQPFCKNEQLPEELNEYKRIAYNYARIENSIAVLSDMHTNISYIYYGGTAETLGIARKETIKILNQSGKKKSLNISIRMTWRKSMYRNFVSTIF